MKKNSTLTELLIGIAVIGILSQAVCLVFQNRVYNAVGLWVGVLISGGMAIHMQRSIEDGLDLMGESGVKHMQKASALRMLVACAVMAIVLYKGWGNPITLLVGVMALKVGAYMQPLVHKILIKMEERRRRM